MRSFQSSYAFRYLLKLILCLVLFVFVTAFTTFAQDEQDSPDAAQRFTPEQLEGFETNIRPLLAKHCYECHSRDSKPAKGGLLLDSREGLLRGGDSGAAIIPGQPEDSLLISSVKYQSYEMPPDGKLTDKQVQLLSQWISNGAAWPSTETPQTDRTGQTIDWQQARQSHWSFRRVIRPDLPEVKNKDWTRSAIDYFVLSQLDANALAPAPQADRRTLIRRLYLDILGTQPNQQQVDHFVGSEAPDAYAELIDSLLSSPQYGEKWGRHWLDVARYNEGFGGFTDNAPNPHAWRYRDWVVRKLNADLPYNEFVRQQIAGDIEGDIESAIGTGFLALGPTFRTDGGDPDSAAAAKSETLDDRVDTLTRGFMGLTVACARCHDHKFDPIPTLDYYSLAGIFNNSASVVSPISAQPIVDAFNRAQNEFNRLNNELKKANDEIKKAGDKATAEQKSIRDKLQQQRDLAQTKIPTRFDEAHTLRDTGDGNMKVALRGDIRKPGPEAPRRFLRIIEGEAPVLYDNGSGRKQLADSVAHKDNPLTVRVIVNRLWMHHFGRPIVMSPSNFGTLGNIPSHPLLLDWLASELIANHWSLKRLHREILLSATYRQSSQFNETHFAIDGDNKFLWRYSPRRMDVEMWRDTIMQATGELNPQIGGPPQQDILRSNRRTVYASTSRNGDQFASDRFLKLFDFAAPRASIAKRTTTTVPTQFLFLLNSSFMVDRARQFHERLSNYSQDPIAKIEFAYSLLHNRPPSAEEAAIGVDFVTVTTNQSPDDKLDRWIQYCQALLSSNELMFIR